MKLLKVLYLSLCIVACTGANAQDDVLVLFEGEKLLPGATWQQSIRVGDGFRTNCGIDETITRLQEKAVDYGGNLIVLTDITKPDAWSTCYRISAEVYAVKNAEEYKMVKKQKEDSFARTLISDTASYALIYFYRPSVSSGSMLNYPVKLAGKPVWKARNGTYYQHRAEAPGNLKLWVEGGNDISVQIEPGKVYYVRCTAEKAIFTTYPVMTLAPAELAIYEIRSIKQ